MKRKTMLIGSGLAGLAIIIAAVYFFSLAEPAQLHTSGLVDGRWTQKGLNQAQRGNQIILTPNRLSPARTPFSIDRTQAVVGQGFTFMNYVSEQQSVFYRFNLSLDKTEKLFTLKGNIDGGVVTNDGQGLLYREMIASSDLEGYLYYQTKTRPLKKLLNRCNWYGVAPDRRAVVANGITNGQALEGPRRLYLIRLDQGTVTRLPAATCPEDLERLIMFACSWSSDSRYFLIEGKVFDATTGVLVKDFNQNVAKLSMFSWSPIGAQLAFAIQTPANAQYFVTEEHHNLFLSDQIGIFNPADQSLRSLPLDAGLATALCWDQEGDQLAVMALPQTAAAAYINKANGANQVDRLDLVIVDRAELTATKRLTKLPLIDLKVFTNGTVVYSRLYGNTLGIAGLELTNGRSKRLVADDALLLKVFKGQAVLTTSDGLYQIQPGLGTAKIASYEDGGDFAYYPEWHKLVIGYDNRIVIMKLK